MRYTSFNKGLNVKLQKKKKIHFVSVRHQRWVITEWNDLRIRLPSLESYWKATDCGGTVNGSTASGVTLQWHFLWDAEVCGNRYSRCPWFLIPL